MATAVAKTPSAWDGLVEGAALKVGTAARQLARTAGEISGEGRIGHLTELRSDADELVRRSDMLVKLADEKE